MKRIRNVGVIALAVVAAIAFAQDTFKLRRTVAVGDTVNMKLTANIEVMGMEALFTAKVTEKVVKVDANGDYTIESTQGEGKVKFGDQEMDAPGGSPTTTKYSAAGEILEVKGDEVSDDALRIANMSSWKFEGTDYKVGDVIKYETKASAKNGNVPSASEIKVDGLETLNGTAAVRLVYTYKETAGETPAESKGTAWVSQKDGSLIKVTGEYKNAPFPGAPGPINAKITIERI
jgi:hypothetical protein